MCHTNVVSANKALSVTLQWPGNESQRKHTATLRISDRQSTQRLTDTNQNGVKKKKKKKKKKN